jgi:hypothetical protein
MGRRSTTGSTLAVCHLLTLEAVLSEYCLRFLSWVAANEGYTLVSAILHLHPDNYHQQHRRSAVSACRIDGSGLGRRCSCSVVVVSIPGTSGLGCEVSGPFEQPGQRIIRYLAFTDILGHQTTIIVV